MSVVKASLVRRAVLTLVAGAAIAFPSFANADILGGLSFRVGFFHPMRDSVRGLTDFASFGAGVDYKLGIIPKVFNGDHWSTSISADFHYSERKSGVLRFIPVSLNQVYTFDSQNGHTPYAGFCVTGATFGTTGTVPKQPTITRFGGGLILGFNLSTKLYVEGRYEWFDKHGALASPEGFRGYVGYHF